MQSSPKCHANDEHFFSKSFRMRVYESYSLSQYDYPFHFSPHEPFIQPRGRRLDESKAFCLKTHQELGAVNYRTIFKDVRGNCFCASLLRTQIYSPSYMEHMLSNKMNNDGRQMTIGIAFPGFNSLGRSLTPIFLFLFF